MIRILLFSAFLLSYITASSQNLSYTCPRDTIIGCGINCITVKGTIPDIRLQATDYTVVNVSSASACRPYIDPGSPGPSASIPDDDIYSASISIPFTFNYYGTPYNALLVSPNGGVSFNVADAGQGTHYITSPGDLPNTGYDPLYIMGPYHDIDFSVATAHFKQIKYNTIGTAPNRKWVVSFFRIPLFDCNDLFENTHQIILHETSNIVEVWIKDKQICTTWPTATPGRAIVGMQDGTRTKGIMAPGRGTAAQWGTLNMNETWRFIPKDGQPAYSQTELLDGSGAVVANGDTVRVNASTFEVTFTNVCIPTANVPTTYVIKTTYKRPNDITQTFYSLDTIVVTRTNELPVTTSSTQTNCGGSTGSVTVTPAGGTGPYTYSNNGGPTQTSGTFTNLGAGTYNITVTDALGCTSTTPVTVTALPNVSATATSTGTSCPGVNNGTITVTAAGTAPHTFVLNGGTPQSSNVFTGLAGGTYTITFTDAVGCSGTVTSTVTAGIALTATSTSTAASCPGVNNGSMTVNPTSGTAPYSYSIDGGPVQSGNVFTGLAGGTHTVTFTDANGCTGTRVAFLTVGTALNVTTTTTAASCGGNNGTVTVTPTNGTSPYTYSVDGGPAQTSNVITGLSAGAHTVLVTDANGCTATRNITISSGTNITATVVSTATACNTANTGTVTVTPSGGTTPFSYSINGGPSQSSNVFTGLAAGAYTITFTDAGGCTGTASATVTAGTNLTATAATTGTSCAAAVDGTITVTVSGGTAPYSYSLDGGASQASNVFTGVAAGAHTISITDANSCAGTVSATVTSGAGITGTATSTPTSCVGALNGSITVTANSGIAPYTYSLDGGTFQSSATFNGVSGAAHVVTIRDAAGCEGTVNVTVSSGAGISGTSTFTAASCAGVNNGTITVTPSSGQAPYTYSLNGGTPQASSTFTGVAAGPHTVTFTDANGCIGTNNITVTAGSAITGSATATATSCPTASNGVITVSVTSGATPYTYSLDGGTSQSSNIFTGVSTGAHNITFTDANGCTGTTSVNVATGAAITGSATSTPASCPSVSNGIITVTPTTGTAPYTYALDGGTSQASNIFNGVAAGPHTVSFTDANGCTGTATVTVTAGAALTGTAASTVTSCPGVNDAVITVTPTSGTSPYSYVLDGGTSQTSNVFNNVASGAHSITFTDALGCSGTATVSTTAGAPLVASTTTTATSCPSVNNGLITVNPATGTAPYTYSLDGGPYQSSNLFSGISAGIHTIAFTDAIGCTGTAANVNIPAGAAIIGTVANTGTSCPAVSNGTITVTPTTGTSPYTFTLDGGAAQNSNVFTGVSSGNHTVTFTDANGCTASLTTTVSPGVANTASATATATTCPGVNNGTITVTPVTGTAPYSYSLDGGAAQSSGSFSGLTPGAHTVLVTDANGCTATATATVGSGTGLQSTTATTATSCPTVNNGTITITPTTGTSPYQYILNGGTPQSSNIFSNLAPGNYTITLSDALGCQGTVNATVSMGSSLTSTVLTANPPCAFINDGTITITATSGVAPYQYSIGGALQTSNVFNSLAPGNYTISITDALGCSGTNTATLSTNSAIAIIATATDPVCNGGNTGTIVLSATGGVAPYQYSKDGGTAYQPAGTYNNLQAGTYNFRVRDNVGCIKDTSITLGQPSLLTAAATSTTSTCNGNDGTINVSAAGGTPGYTYSIDNGTNFQASPSFTVSYGDYNDIIIKDANGCTAFTSTTVTLLAQLIVNAGNDTTICLESLATFNPVTNGQNPSYFWTTLAGDSVSIIKNAEVSPVDTTTYVLQITWGVCSGKDTMTVNVLHRPIANAGTDIRICIGDSTKLSGSYSNASGPVKYLWTPAELVRDAEIADPWALNTQTQVFTLTVTDDYGCELSSSDDMTVHIQPPVPAFAGNDTIAIPGTPHMLMGSGGVQYLWSPSSVIDNPYAATPMATITSDTWFTLEVRDMAGCIGYDSLFVKVYNGPTYYIPNAFTPNGDGLNDIFRPIPSGISRTDYFRIFNRYGEMIFETNQYLKGWDGTYKGKIQPMGAYTWMIKGMDKNGQKVEMKGTVIMVQ